MSQTPTSCNRDEPIACGFAFINPDCGEKCFIHGRFVPPAEFKCAGINIPLHGVAKEVGEQEQALLGIQSVINVDLQAI